MKYVKIEMVGKRFGRWLVLADHPEKYKGRWQFLCKCDCGTEKVVDGNRMRSGGSKSCGCLNREATSKSNSTHKLSKTPLYVLWLNVRKRCYDTKIRQYKDYGGRGIGMYDTWIDNPIAFINWCKENGWQKGLQLDRKDNDGHYEPSNLRFITHKQQQRNTRKNVMHTHDGQTKCLSEWVEHLGISYRMVMSRLRRNWSIHDALFGTPNMLIRRKRPSNIYFTYNGQTKILIEWAEELNINYKKIYSRINKLKWPIEKALTTP